MNFIIKTDAFVNSCHYRERGNDIHVYHLDFSRVYQNYFKLDSKLIQLNFSHSDGSFNSSWRIDTKMWNIQLGNKLSLNISGELWNQPLIDFYVDDVLQQSQYLGSKFILTTNYDIITSNHLLGLTLQMGYKTRGYSLGEQLDRGLVLRSGLTFKLGNKSL